MKRSKWKGIYTNDVSLEKNTNIILKSRNSTIVPKFIGLTFKIHTGKSFKKVTVTEEMVSHKFGEFSPTRSEFIFKKKKKKK